MNLYDYPSMSKAISKIAPDLPTIQRVIFAKNINNMCVHGHSDFSPAELLAIVRYLNITGTLDRDQRNKLMGLIYDAEKVINVDK